MTDKIAPQIHYRSVTERGDSGATERQGAMAWPGIESEALRSLYDSSADGFDW